MEKKSKNIGTIVRGNLFDTDVLLENWKVIAFAVLLILITIVSSHSADEKVYEISKLQKEVRELKSEFVDVRTQLMNSRMGSNLQEKVRKIGLEQSTTPPHVIKVNNN
ncbi:MAG: FtsL-like putative cell division protein [Bacteroidota bacterium]